jgi:hypothetical protein
MAVEAGLGHPVPPGFLVFAVKLAPTYFVQARIDITGRQTIQRFKLERFLEGQANQDAASVAIDKISTRRVLEILRRAKIHVNTLGKYICKNSTGRSNKHARLITIAEQISGNARHHTAGCRPLNVECSLT